MKLINPSFEIIHQGSGLDGMYKQIERVGRTCYSEDTEVLTDLGWIKFRDLSKKSLCKVLTYDPKTNLLRWDDPNLLTKTIDEELVEIDHPRIKLKVTKNHRIYQSVPEKREYSFLTAAQLIGEEKIPKSRQNRFRIPKFFIGSKRDFVEIPKLHHEKYVKQGSLPDKLVSLDIPCNLDYMVIAGAFISEGHTFHGEKYKTGSYCQITQDESSELYKLVLNSLNNLGWKYSINRDPRKPNIKWIKFGDQCLVEFFDKEFGKGSKNKHLPEYFRTLPDEYLSTMIKLMYLGDGTHSRVRKERYISYSKRLLDELQQAFILLGKNASYSFKESVRSLEESSRDSWIIQRSKHIKLSDKKQQTVYCTQTNTGIICIRYKGVSCWCGNCYRSGDKTTDTSALPFVDRMVKSNHLAMCEHGTVYLKDFIGRSEEYFENPLGKYANNKFSKYVTKDVGEYCMAFVTTNYRVLVENGWEGDLKYLCEPTEDHEKRITVRFITDRATSHEFVRHRVFSFAQESQRYVGYDKEKFGGEIEYIFPSWVLEDSRTWIIMYRSLKESEKSYLELRQEGWKPEEARVVLPNATKTELVMTGFVSDWTHFFDLRALGTTGRPHPEAKRLALPLYEEFKRLGYE